MIELSPARKAELISKVKNYFDDELEQEIGGFDVEFLLDFFIKELGNQIYNQALSDVHGLLENQMSTMADTLFDLEKSVE